jgi:predicted RNase H-like HicB family nuclease
MKRDIERKEVEYYLNLIYPITVHPDPEGGFVAEIEDLPGCMTQSESLDALYKAIDEARQLWIRTTYEEGQPIPLPRDMEQYTGKFIVRIPKRLHHNLARTAKHEGVSLNQYVLSLLASGIVRDSVIGIETGLRLWPRTAKIWGSDQEVLDLDQLVATPRGEVKGTD